MRRNMNRTQQDHWKPLKRKRCATGSDYFDPEYDETLDILVHIGCKGSRWEAEVAPKAGFLGILGLDFLSPA
jgi:hypothetical protein